MPKEKAPPRVTRKHLARAQRERLVSRILLIGVGLALTAAVAVIGYGIVEQEILLPRRPAATVNGDEISRDELGARTALAQADLLQQRRSAEQMLSFFVDSPEAQQSLQQQISQIDAQLNDPNYMAAQTLQSLIRARLIRREAERRGVTVTEDDIQRAIQEAFGFYAGGTPTAAPTPTIDAALVAQSTSTATPAGTPTVVATPSSAASPTALAAATVGPSPTPRPTATAYTREGFDGEWQQYLDDFQSSLGVGESYVRDRFAENLYRDRLRETFRGIVPREEDQVWAKHILVPDQGLAQALLSRLRQGEAWDALAAASSLDTTNKDRGGDLGWFSRGAMVDAFEAAAFEGEVDEIVGPVQTSFGWHLILIVDHAQRKLDAAAYEAALDQALGSWLTSALEQAELVFDPALVAPTAVATASSTPATSTPAGSVTP
jgi:parvulin-like peptidyl-prolyl isomerase